LTESAYHSAELAARAQGTCKLIQKIVHTRDHDTPRALSSDLHDIPLTQPSLTECPDRDRDLMLAGDAGTASRTATSAP
jgi:hypothetical protein